MTREPCCDASSIACSTRSRVCSGLKNSSRARSGNMKVPTRPIGASTMPLRNGSAAQRRLKFGGTEPALAAELFGNIGERRSIKAHVALDPHRRRQIAQANIGSRGGRRLERRLGRRGSWLLSAAAVAKHAIELFGERRDGAVALQ